MPDSSTSTSTATGLTADELHGLRLLEEVDLATVGPLLRNCPVRTLAAGDVLMRAGKANRHLYLVLSGRLRVHLDEKLEDPIAVLEPGESVGEISVIDSQPASASVVADTATRLLEVDEEIMWMLADTSHAVSNNLLKTLAGRLRYGNDVIFRDREQLREFRFQAMVDALTGIYNRHWLNQMLPRQMDRSRSSDEPLSLIMIDIDHFKHYNDSHGHVAGDHALYTVARTVRDNVRPADMAARYGGEEFVVLLPSSDAAGAHRVGERLLSAARKAEIRFPHGPPLPHVTISLGLAQMRTEYTAEQFISATDAALYRAKDAGRDRLSD